MDLILKFSKKTGKKSVVLDGETGTSSTANTQQNTPQKEVDEVSESGSHYSMDDRDVEDVIESRRHTVTAPLNDKSADVLSSIISEEYCEEEVNFELPPIDGKLANVLNKWLRNLPSRDKVKELFKQCMLPNNVEGLRPVKINALLYNKLLPNYKINDQRLRGINTFFARGLGPIVSIWDKILKWETALSSVGNVPITGSFGSISMGGLTLDLTDIRRQLDKALRLLSAGHSLILSRRRQQLRSFLDPKFHYLLKDDNPITSELLGDNVDQKVCEAIKVSDAAQKLKLQAKNHGRNRGRFNFNQVRRGVGRFNRNRQFSREFRENSHPYSRQLHFSGYASAPAQSRGYQGRGRFSRGRFQRGNQCYHRKK